MFEQLISEFKSPFCDIHKHSKHFMNIHNRHIKIELYPAAHRLCRMLRLLAKQKAIHHCYWSDALCKPVGAPQTLTSSTSNFITQQSRSTDIGHMPICGCTYDRRILTQLALIYAITRCNKLHLKWFAK